MAALPTATQHPPCVSVKRWIVIATFLGVFCLGYLCMISVESSVTLKSQKKTAMRQGSDIHTHAASLESQTRTTFNTTKTATTETFHHAPIIVIATKKDVLTRVSDKLARNITNFNKKQALLITAQKKRIPPPMSVADIIHMKPPSFLANYKNPCWYETIPTMVSGLSRQPVGALRRLRCLPYYMIVGQPKSGTTDFYFALQMHPEVVKCNIKEPHWWTRKRTIPKNSLLRNYVNYFSEATQEIQNITRKTSSGERFYPRITGEASASTFWDMSYWRLMQENRGLNEPLYMTAHYIKHILPDIKIMVILRNPIDRLLSDSFYFNRAKTMEMFHDQVVESVGMLRDCFEQLSVDSCILTNSTLTGQLKARVHIGVYHVFLVAWLKVFPRSQVRVIQLEEYSRNRTSALNDILKFLDIDPLPQSKVLALQETGARNARTKPMSMLNKTRVLLEEFYRPFNERLAALLDDDKFLWNTPLPTDADTAAAPT